MLLVNQLIVGFRVFPYHVHQSLIASDMLSNSHQIWRDWLWWLSLMSVYIWHTHCFLERNRDLPHLPPEEYACLFLGGLRWGMGMLAIQCPELGQILWFSMNEIIWGRLDTIMVCNISRILSINKSSIPESAAYPPINPNSTICFRFKIISKLIEDSACLSDIARMPLKNNS